MQNNFSKLFEIIDNKVKIEEIISKYLHLEQKGNNYLGLCPFHDDTSPSLHVSPSKKIYKCFSCGAGGNALKFIQNYEHLNFINALKKLCDYLQIDWKEYLSEEKINIDHESEKIKEINLKAKNYYSYLLKQEIIKSENKLAKYLSQRKIEKKLLGKFELGYAGKNNSLSNYLLKKKYSEEEILKAKLAINFNGNLIDFFQDRLIFPIISENNEILGFSGRSLQKEQTNFPKYLNSLETKIFHKQEILYNLNHARTKIQIAQEVIIVEGFMDVLAYDKCGWENVVAIMGTNFSKNHLRTLSNLTDHFILSFDNDQAGMKISFAVGKLLLREGKQVEIIQIKNAKDFDEFVNKYSIEIIKKAINKKIYFVTFMITKIISKDNLKEQEIRQLLKIISLESDGIQREKFLQELKLQSKYEFSDFLINKYYQQVLTGQLKDKETKNADYDPKYDKIIDSTIEKIVFKIEQEETTLLFLLLTNQIVSINDHLFITDKLRWFYNKIFYLYKDKKFNLVELNLDGFTEQEEIIINQLKKLHNTIKNRDLNLEKINLEINDRVLNINFLNKLLVKEKIKQDLQQTQDKNALDWLLKKTLSE